nr:PREDICTED: uncharacterized protein LOC105679574 [Linepithema humile]
MPNPSPTDAGSAIGSRGTTTKRRKTPERTPSQNPATGNATGGAVPKQRVHQYFKQLYCDQGRLDSAKAEEEHVEPSTPKDVARLTDPFAERKTRVDQEKLSLAQKRFLWDKGCYEHNFILQEILTDAQRNRRQAVVVWLDLSNAFGSVPHATIRCAFVRAGEPRKVIEIWRSMYDNCTTRVRTVEGYTASNTALSTFAWE